MTVNVRTERPPAEGDGWEKDLAAQKRAIRHVTKVQVRIPIGAATYYVPVSKAEALTLAEKAAQAIPRSGGITVVVAPLDADGATQAQFAPRHTNDGFLPAVVDVTDDPAGWPQVLLGGCDNPRCDYGSDFHG